MRHWLDDDRPGSYIRWHYGVPAYLGTRVVFTYRGRHPGVITWFTKRAYLRIKFDDGIGDDLMYHPTWEMEYPSIDSMPSPDLVSGNTHSSQPTETSTP